MTPTPGVTPQLWIGVAWGLGGSLLFWLPVLYLVWRALHR